MLEGVFRTLHDSSTVLCTTKTCGMTKKTSINAAFMGFGDSISYAPLRCARAFSFCLDTKRNKKVKAVHPPLENYTSFHYSRRYRLVFQSSALSPATRKRPPRRTGLRQGFGYAPFRLFFYAMAVRPEKKSTSNTQDSPQIYAPTLAAMFLTMFKEHTDEM